MTRTTTPGPFGSTLRLSGPAGDLVAEPTRLPSGHAHVTAWIVSASGCAEPLTRRCGEPLREAWHTGGNPALFAAMEQLYPRLFPQAHAEVA